MTALRQRSRDKLVPTSASASVFPGRQQIRKTALLLAFVLLSTLSPAAIIGNLTACEGERGVHQNKIANTALDCNLATQTVLQLLDLLFDADEVSMAFVIGQSTLAT